MRTTNETRKSAGVESHKRSGRFSEFLQRRRGRTLSPDEVFAIFDSTTPVHIDERLVERRAALLDQLGINPGEMTRQEASNEYFHLRRSKLKEIRGRRSRVARITRWKLGKAKAAAEAYASFVLNAAPTPDHPDWIDKGELMVPTKGTLMEIGPIARTLNLVRIDTPRVIKKGLRAAGHMAKEKAAKPMYNRLPEGLRARLRWFTEYNPNHSARTVVEDKSREVVKPPKRHLGRNIAAVSSVYAAAAGMYYWFMSNIVFAVDDAILLMTQSLFKK